MVSESKAILVVEDNDLVLSVASEMLRDAGYDVHVAGDAATALALAAACVLDVLLCDLVLRGPGGIETARRIVTAQPGVRVVFMSGHGDAVLRARGQLPGSSVLRKPFNQDELLRHVAGA